MLHSHAQIAGKRRQFLHVRKGRKARSITYDDRSQEMPPACFHALVPGLSIGAPLRSRNLEYFFHEQIASKGGVEALHLVGRKPINGKGLLHIRISPEKARRKGGISERNQNPIERSLFRGWRCSNGKFELGVKNQNIHSIKGACFEAHNPILATKWLEFCNNPDDDQALNRLGNEIDELLCRFLPRGRFLGVLLDWEEEIRQEAGLLLYTRYLAGNRGLIEATRAKDHIEIAGHIRRSVWVALKVTVWRYRKKLHQWIQIFESNGNLDEHPLAVWPHPADYRRIGELPLEVQLNLVRAALRRAVCEKHLGAQNVELACTLLEGNVTQAELAKSRGITRQAINQRLASVRKYLQGAIQNEEFPLS